MYYPCSENKGADQLRGYRFSHDAARVIMRLICTSTSISLIISLSLSGLLFLGDHTMSRPEEDNILMC